MLDPLIINDYYFLWTLFWVNCKTLSAHWVGEGGKYKEHLTLNEHLLCARPSAVLRHRFFILKFIFQLLCVCMLSNFSCV